MYMLMYTYKIHTWPGNPLIVFPYLILASTALFSILSFVVSNDAHRIVRIRLVSLDSRMGVGLDERDVCSILRYIYLYLASACFLLFIYNFMF